MTELSREPRTFRQIRRTYLLALGAVGLLAICSQWVIQRALNQCEADAELINVAGRQRMLSQRLAKATLALAHVGDEASCAETLRAALELETSHFWLRGQAEIGAESVQALDEVWAHGERLVRLARSVASGPSSEVPVQELLAVESEFLPRMDRIVGGLEDQAAARVSHVRVLELLLLLAAFAVLIVEARVVFRPMARRLSMQLRRIDDARERAETLLVDRDRALANLSANTQLLTTVGEEVRAPLNEVIGLNDILLESNLDGEELDLAQGVQRSARHLLSVVDAVLEGARAEPGRIQLELGLVDLDELADELIEPLRARVDASRVEVRCSLLATRPTRVLGDPIRLRQIGHNLISYAAKCTQDGSIELSIELESQPGGARLLMTVADTGPGIAPGQISSIFEPFQPADRNLGGTGLGLTIARALCEAMGGKLEVSSRLGEGTAITASIPVERRISRSEEGVRPEASRWLDVLMVDDDPVDRRILGHLVERCGARLRPCVSADQAIDALKDTRPDVVLLDLDLGAGSGWDNVVNALGDLPEMERPRLVGISRAARDLTQDQRDTFDAFMQKPFTAATLEEALRSLDAAA